MRIDGMKKKYAACPGNEYIPKVDRYRKRESIAKSTSRTLINDAFLDMIAIYSCSHVLDDNFLPDIEE